jgi:hypothetical protein
MVNILKTFAVDKDNKNVAINEGTCKINQCDRAYCCPDEDAGCCSAVTTPSVIISLLPYNFPLYISTCKIYSQCEDC